MPLPKPRVDHVGILEPESVQEIGRRLSDKQMQASDLAETIEVLAAEHNIADVVVLPTCQHEQLWHSRFMRQPEIPPSIGTATRPASIVPQGKAAPPYPRRDRDVTLAD